jgi:hypothetical protein
MPARNKNGRLEEAIALLINSQAALANNQAAFLNNQAVFLNNQAAFLSVARETQEDMALIRRELEQIKTILMRHEQILQSLPEAVRDKIGFKTR